MRVLLLTRGFGDYIIELANSISSMVETHLILAKKDEWILKALDPKVKVFFSRAPSVKRFSNLFVIARIALYIRRIKPDIIHMQSGIVWELLLMRLFRKRTFVVTVHDVIKHPRRGFLRFFPQSFLDYGALHAAGVIVHGASMRQLAKRYYSRTSRRFGTEIASIPHGIISRYGMGVASAAVVASRVLLFGSIDEWKGVEYFIQAERSVRKAIPEVKFIIAGSSSDPDYYRSLVGDDQCIELRLKYQTSDEVRGLFTSADLLVLPYIEASQSGVLQLGMAFGIPTVVTSVGGLPDVVRDGYNGLVVPPCDADALAQAIVRLLTDVELRAKIIHNIVKERETTYNWRNIALKTVDFYSHLLKRR